MAQPIWQPSKGRVERANMTAFARQVAQAHGEELREYAQLRAWSVEHPELFWPALWRFADVRASRPWRRVLEDGDRMPGARWFVGAELNFAEKPAPTLRRSPGDHRLDLVHPACARSSARGKKGTLKRTQNCGTRFAASRVDRGQKGGSAPA